jgi:uncharacterized protein
MPLLWVLVGVLGLGALCVAYGVFIEHGWYRLRRYRLDILPADGAAGLSILHLSDLHFLRHDRRKGRFVAGLPGADVTVVTGDLVGEPEAVETVVDALRPVRGRVASLFVLGSNDYFAPKPTSYLRYFRRHHLRKGRRRQIRGRGGDLRARLEADGWVHLKNVRGEMALDGERFELSGMDDAHIHRADLRVVPRERPDLFGIAVTHSPDPVPELVAANWDLVIAGHTHGGQVRLPLIGALVTNSHMPRRLVSGLIRLGPSYLHTSPGLGTSKYAPFRFLCRPEATLLELRPARTAVAGRAGTLAAAGRAGRRDVAQFGSAQRSGR